MNSLGNYINVLLLIALLYSCSQNNHSVIGNSKTDNVFYDISLDVNPNTIDSIQVLFQPFAETPSVQCGYEFTIKESKQVTLHDRLFLDSLENILSVLIPDDSVHTHSVIYCKLFFHENISKDLHLGLFWGTCYDGVNMKDDLVLQKVIKQKIGFYNYFNKDQLKYFKEIN